VGIERGVRGWRIGGRSGCLGGSRGGRECGGGGIGVCEGGFLISGFDVLREEKGIDDLIGFRVGVVIWFISSNGRF
jgi:hypothetical protein